MMSVLATPALPLHTAGKYVAAAYIVFFALILIYVAIMATRLNRINRELGELLERTPAPPHAELEAALHEAEATVPEESAHV
jgi:CcmD family protein